MHDLIIVKARITMKTTDEGGRKSGFTSGYRPNHVFEMPENFKDLVSFVGDIQFDDQDMINPGETKIVTVRFLNVPEVERYIQKGQRWFINEGARNVGVGEMLGE
jgi:translation elongation factor EF-Tu-like GTPase